MFMLNSNEPIKVAHLPKLDNQSMLNGALLIERAFSESMKIFWSFEKAKNILIEKE